MSVTSNSDDERYANESFESPSENDIVETSDINSEIDYDDNDDACDGDADSDAKSLAKIKSPNKHAPMPTTNNYPGSFRSNKMDPKERVRGGGGKNLSLCSSSSSSSMENEIEYVNNNDDDDNNDVILKQQSLSNFSTLSMNFDTTSEIISDRSKGQLPIGHSQRSQRTQRSQRKGHPDVFRKQSLDNVMEQNENSEYCTDDEDYEAIKKMEKFYRRSLQIEEQSLSAKKQHSNRSNKKVIKELVTTRNNEYVSGKKQNAAEIREIREIREKQEHVVEQEEELVQEQEQGEEQGQSHIEECAENEIEKEINESIAEPNRENNLMTPKECDIIAASRMLQPMENFFDQLKLPNTDEITKSLINVVKNTILNQTRSLSALDDKKPSSESPRKSKSYTSNRKKPKENLLISHGDKLKPLNGEEIQRKQLEKYDDDHCKKEMIGDHCRKEDQQKMRNEKYDKIKEEHKQLKHIEEGYVSCESFNALENYSEQMPSHNVSSDRIYRTNNFNSDDCLFQKRRYKNSQKAPLHDTHKLPPHPRKSWTFTNDRMREIERQNHILLRKILSQKPTNKQMPSQYGMKKQQEQQRSLVNCAARVTSSSLNRKKQQRQIDFENRILQKKLEAISLRRPQLP